jgi:hypothetical protein
MTFSARSAALCSITLAGLLALSACGKNEQQSPSQPAAPSTAPAPASTAAKPAPSTTAAAPAATGTAAAAATAPAAASTSAAATSAAAAGFQVSSVTLGDAHKVKKEVSSFSPSQKTIYVSVDTTGSTPGATLNAKWTYLDKNQTIVSTSQSIVADSPSTTTFSMKNPDLWPEGKYKVDVSLDGKQVASKTFEVKKG